MRCVLRILGNFYRDESPYTYTKTKVSNKTRKYVVCLKKSRLLIDIVIYNKKLTRIMNSVRINKLAY